MSILQKRELLKGKISIFPDFSTAQKMAFTPPQGCKEILLFPFGLLEKLQTVNRDHCQLYTNQVLYRVSHVWGTPFLEKAKMIFERKGNSRSL